MKNCIRVEGKKLCIGSLSSEYREFLEAKGKSVGCPMLSTGLQKVIGGRVICGTFDRQPHCWVEKGSKLYDLQHLAGDSVSLIVSTTDDRNYHRRDVRARELALGVGVTGAEFREWTPRFRKAMAAEE